MATGRRAPTPAGPAGYLDTPLGEFLDALSAARPDPGGGSAAALAVALGASLCAMTAGLSAHQLPQAEHVAAEARLLRDRAAPLAQADAEGYREVLAALRAEDGRRQRVSEALSQASRVPLEVAEIAVRVAALAADVAADGNPHVRGDAIAAAVLAAAGAQAAATLVWINLAGTGDERPALAERLAADAARLAAQAGTKAT